ncbi:MAG: hypothetical protein ACI8XV_003090 [Arenicella sp.]|jgi:hypothetical protein
MSKTRDNHFVPQWYQKGFLSNPENNLFFLDLTPDEILYPNGTPVTLPDGTAKKHRHLNHFPTSKCFYQKDLYTTFFGQYISDDIETLLFGKVDDEGAKAVRAFINTDMRGWHEHFINFFSFIDTQKIRTPKGLDWISFQYQSLNQIELMVEMQSIRSLHCALWTEGVREIVSAECSDIKFLISDHPVTIYNHACSPGHALCKYPNDPSIQLKASQTLFPLDRNHCLILTNLEYAKNHDLIDPTERRTHSKLMRNSLVRTDNYIRTRKLNENEVSAINLVLKARAKRYIAAEKKEWLYPERQINVTWDSAKKILLPPKDELYHFGGETYVGYDDGTTLYQDEFGRKYPENKHLRKVIPKKLGNNQLCGCGSGRKYKHCCLGKPENDRPTWGVLSIRERNIILYRGLYGILGLNKGKKWDDVRRELSNGQIVDIYSLYCSLWQIETDLYSLFPKPDNRFRVVYTGMLDPRTILLPLAAVPCFDEIIIQHPFIHPQAVKKEFSPLENPHRHKYQTLKNIFLLLSIEPFVMSGRVNFIPDPCMFDNLLHREMINMAKERSGSQSINKAEKQRMMKLGEDDFFRTMRGQSRERLKHQVAHYDPGLSDEEVENIVEYMRKLNDGDPLAILQEDLYDKGGQLMMTSMAPNFEMALFMAQITGSAILTDSETRWDELVHSQSTIGGKVSNQMKSLTDIINNNQYIFSADHNVNLDRTVRSKFGVLRKIFHEVFIHAKEKQSVLNRSLFEKYKYDFEKGTKNANGAYNMQEENVFKARLKFLIPQSGFTHNNVQRLLIKSGSSGHLNDVPMAIFIEPKKK